MNNKLKDKVYLNRLSIVLSFLLLNIFYVYNVCLQKQILSIVGPSGDAFYAVLWLPSRFRQLFILLFCALSMGAYLMWVVSRTYCRFLLSQSLYKHQKFYFVPWTFIGRLDCSTEMLCFLDSPLSHSCDVTFLELLELILCLKKGSIPTAIE